MKHVWTFVCAAVVIAGAASPGRAADAAYPQRPIRLIIPQSPGGASDTVGRTVAQKLTERLGQQVVADTGRARPVTSAPRS